MTPKIGGTPPKIGEKIPKIEEKSPKFLFKGGHLDPIIFEAGGVLPVPNWEGGAPKLGEGWGEGGEFLGFRFSY